jgi:DNA-binding Xre family transcriptional regulator
MSEGKQLIDTLKGELRRRSVTYHELAAVLDLSHASVKRLFAEHNFTLERVELICRFLGMDMAELFRIMEKKQNRLASLTVAQEQMLVSDIKLLCMAHALLNKWSFEEVLATYTITEHEAIRLMATLDRLRIIDLLPGNRYKLLVSRKFRWLPNGPIQKFFEQQLQADFFDASFNHRGEARIFISAMLSRGSVEKLNSILARAADEINELHLEDEKLELGQRSGMSVVLAARPWEAKVFVALRRKQSAIRRPR